MNKQAYQYLFQQETLYRVPEPEPVVAAEAIPEPEQALLDSLATTAVPHGAMGTTPAAPVTETVEVKPPTPPAPEPIQAPQPVVPQVNHKVLLLVDDELTPSEQILLENILKSVNLNLDGVDLLNLAGSGLINVRPVLASKRVHHFISFGVPFTEIRLNITLNRYEPTQLAGINFMLADPLSAIEADRALKRQLWLSLQQLFQH